MPDVRFRIVTFFEPMNEIFNSYNLKSRVTNIIVSSSVFRDSGGSYELREKILDHLWKMLYNTHGMSNEDKSLEKFLDVVREKYGAEAVSADDVVRMDDAKTPVQPISRSKYKVSLPHSTWIIEGMTDGGTKTGGRSMEREGFTLCRMSTGCQAAMYSSRGSVDTAEFISRFDENLPLINRYMDDCLSECARNRMICDLVVSTAKGIVAQVVEEGVDIPKVTCVRGTPERRAVLYFEGTNNKINCPLDHLRSRLYRRFVLKRQ